jgi:hypothetical protein
MQNPGAEIMTTEKADFSTKNMRSLHSFQARILASSDELRTDFPIFDDDPGPSID